MPSRGHFVRVISRPWEMTRPKKNGGGDVGESSVFRPPKHASIVWTVFRPGGGGEKVLAKSAESASMWSVKRFLKDFRSVSAVPASGRRGEAWRKGRRMRIRPTEARSGRRCGPGGRAWGASRAAARGSGTGWPIRMCPHKTGRLRTRAQITTFHGLPLASRCWPGAPSASRGAGRSGPPRRRGPSGPRARSG